MKIWVNDGNYMILRDIHFDLCYYKNENYINNLICEKKCSYEEAVKIDYDNNWKYKRYKFRSETQCITEMVLRLLYDGGKFHISDCSKIVFDCRINQEFLEIPREYLNIPLDDGIGTISKCDGIYTVKVFFDYDKYNTLNEYDKKRYILSVIEKNVGLVLDNMSFPKDKFIDVYNRIKQNNYINQYIWKRSVKKTYKAEVLILHEIEKAEIYIIFRNNKNNNILKEKMILSIKPNFWDIHHYLGKIRWISETEIELLDEDGKNGIVCGI